MVTFTVSKTSKSSVGVSESPNTSLTKYGVVAAEPANEERGKRMKVGDSGADAAAAAAALLAFVGVTFSCSPTCGGSDATLPSDVRSEHNRSSAVEIFICELQAREK